MIIDLNCDLGEGEAPARTRALLKAVTSANIACGGHAGDARTMEFCVKEALAQGVKIGAHPGFAERATFGRIARPIDAKDLCELLLPQVGALEVILRAAGTRLHHIKLHGALYHIVENKLLLARAYVEQVRRYWPETVLIAYAGGAVQKAAEEAGVTVWPEVFADRGYQDNGQLVRRDDPRALLTSTAQIQDRLRRLFLYHEIVTVKGHSLKPEARTLCVHSDSPHALRIARLARSWLEGETTA